MESALAPAAAAAPVVSVTDMMSKVASQTKVANDPAPAAAPVVKIVRDVPVMPLANDTAAPIAAEPVDAAPVEPTGEITLSDDDADVLLSAQRNADGTFKTKLDPTEKLDFTIKDKTTGEAKSYSKSLPEIVRLAKDGVTLQTKLQEVQPEVDYYRTNLPQWQQSMQAKTEQIGTLQEQLDAQMELNRVLLTADDEIVIQHRDKYKADMAPEKQLERLRAEREAEVAARDRSAKQAQHAKIAQSFMESRIAPALTAAGSIVGDMAVTGAVTQFTNDLMRNGVIPPAHWPEMERRINAPNGPFQTWLRQESAKRTTESDTVRTAREAAESAQRAAQQVVNDAGRQMAPIGRAATDHATPSPLPKSATARDVINRINNRPLPTTV